MFRNLRFYRVTSPWPESEEQLSEILSDKRFFTLRFLRRAQCRLGITG